MQALIASLVLLAVIAVAMLLPPVRMRLQSWIQTSWVSLLQRARLVRSATVISSSGEEIVVPDAVRTEAIWIRRMGEWSARLQIVLVGILVVALTLLALPRLLPATRADELTILVAPFFEPGGVLTPTGRATAQELVDTLATTVGPGVAVRRIDAPPADREAALALLRETRADVIISGEITTGGMLDAETLTPVLIYAPGGIQAMASLDGFVGRFAFPTVYPLAAQPINGRVVLPRLIRAIADYNNGQYSAAMAALDDLEREQPALRPGLLRTLRAMTWWARGNYEQSASEFRRAIAAMPDAPPDELARLYASLGAVQHDMGDPAARDSFNQAIALLQGQDLGELRYNLALEELRSGNPAAAAVSLEQARRLMPPSTPLLVKLAEAYRLSGQLDAASEALSAATRQIGIDDRIVPFDLRPRLNARLRASVQSERALLRMARLLNARGPLLWELDIAPVLRESDLSQILSDISLALREASNLNQEWSKQAAVADSEQRLIDGSIAMHQARRADLAIRRYRFWLAVVEVELARLRDTRAPTGLAAIWAGLTRTWSPAADALRQIETLEKGQAGNVDLTILRGRALLVNNQENDARTAFETAARLAPERPEPLFHQAMLALPQNRERARQLLEAALQRDPAYFPAHIRLAELAEEEQRWRDAVVHRRWLAERRSGIDETLALARALRLSGPEGYAEAERILMPLVNGNVAAAIIEMSRLYRAAGQLDAARSVLERGQQNTARSAPAYADITHELGLVLIDLEDVDRAERQFEIAINANPRHIPSYLMLAHLERRAGNDRAAARRYAAALDAGANDPAVLEQIGSTLLELHEYNAAVTAYERSIALQPGRATLWYGAAQAYLGIGRLDAADEAARRALERQPIFPEALALLGDITLQRGNLSEAGQQYRAALQQDPALAAAHIGLGRVAAAGGDWSIAAGHFLNAVEENPQSPEAFLWLGEARVRTGDLEGALDAYQQALQLRPDFPEAYFGLAQAQFGAGRIDEALQSVNRALEERARYAEAFLLLGKIYERQGYDTRALEAYKRSIDANPRLAEPHYRRALILIRADRLNEARDDLEIAARLDPNFAEAHYWLGRVHFAQRNFQAAVNRFREAVNRRNGNYPEARYYQGRAEEQLGDLNAAIRSFETVANQSDDALWAGEARAALARLSDR
ncbi:MAG: tetratricopeptide repeat protein [Roseiflexaceae bacterium]|nr:tetratricopeptide repeat protein [Roseiflexus sp.]MDW8212610.1 tetratricopeptide repeat protein [Roseiflexaceae bacterium]